MPNYPEIPKHNFVMRAAVDVNAWMESCNLIDEFAGDKGYEPFKTVLRQMVRNLCWGNAVWAYDAMCNIMNGESIHFAIIHAWNVQLDDACAMNEDFDYARNGGN